MRPIRLAGPAAILAAMALLPGLALAENQNDSIELGLSLSFLKFDTQALIDEKFTVSLGAGYNFTKRHGGEFSFTSTTVSPDKGGGFPIDVDIYRVGYTFNAYPRERFVSFFRAGVGMMTIDPIDPFLAPSHLEESDRQAIIYGGGGLRYFLTDRLALKVAATLDFLDTGDTFLNPGVQTTGDFGVVYLFGGREETEEPAEPEAAPQQPAQEKPEG